MRTSNSVPASLAEQGGAQARVKRTPAELAKEMLADIARRVQEMASWVEAAIQGKCPVTGQDRVKCRDCKIPDWSREGSEDGEGSPHLHELPPRINSLPPFVQRQMRVYSLQKSRL